MSNPFEALEKIFHEPSRLAIMSALLGDSSGISFNELKEVCNLTDGNLSRHLSALEKSKVVEIGKTFVSNRPRTTVSLTPSGRESFLEYLAALEEVLLKATKITQAKTKNSIFTSVKPAKA